jgi:hypothetical protein
MNTPSIKTLSMVFADPKQAKKILLMSRKELLQTEAGKARDLECYNPPKTYDLRLTVLDSIEPGLYGFEGIECTNQDAFDEWASYLNTGDSYAPTIIYWRGRYRVQSIGDFIETMARQGTHFN